MSLVIKHFYSFGEFTLDIEQKVILRSDTPLPLAPKVFDTLMILVENSGRIVEKEELMQRLWPDSFVEESNLAVNIQQLRKSLGDNARQPQFIETVPRRGYRFIAEVTKNVEPHIASKTELSATTDVLTVARVRRSYFSVAAISVLIVGVVAITLWSARSRNVFSASSAPILSASFKSEKFVTGRGSVRAVITPDGKYVAYTSESSGKESIWLRQIETSENIQIVSPTESRYFGLAISPDGNTLYFARRTEGDQPYRIIYRVMTFGGIPVKIVENTEGWIGVAPDGRQISFVRCKYENDDFCSLFVVDVDGKNERRLLTRQRPFRIADNQFSPDGKSIAFAEGQSSTGGREFRLKQIDLASGAESHISSKPFFDITNLKWLPDGDNLLLAAKETHDGRLRIWHVSSTTGAARALTNDATDYLSFSLDKAADKMIATPTSNTFHLYVAKMDDVSNPQNLAAARSGVAFTPEGKIIYAAGNEQDIWTINRDGGEERQLTNNSFSDISPRMSPDNRYIFFTSNRSGTTQVWRMNADGSNPIQLTKQEGGYPRFVSNDNKWVYFFSSLNQNLWRVPADGGTEAQVSLPVSSFSPDGKFVAYFVDGEVNNRIKLVVMSVEDQKVVRTFRLADDASRPIGIDLISGWVSDNKSFYYVTTDGSRNHLWRQLLDADSPQLIGDLGNEEIAHFAVSPDGMSFAMIRGRWIHDAVLIEGLR